MDQRLKSLMEQLGEAINNSLSDSEQIAEVITRIKSGGYDVFLVLEATIGFNEREEVDDPTELNEQLSSANFQVTSQDVKFLKSLHIKVEDEK